MRNAETLKQMLATAGIKSMLNELSNTVVFERPKEETFVRKWQLACEGDIAHVVVMPNVDIAKLEEFVQVRLSSAREGTDLWAESVWAQWTEPIRLKKDWCVSLNPHPLAQIHTHYSHSRTTSRAGPRWPLRRRCKSRLMPGSWRRRWRRHDKNNA